MEKGFSYVDYIIFVLILLVSMLIGLYQGFKKYIPIPKWPRKTNQVAQSEAPIELVNDKKQNPTNDASKVSEYLTASSNMGTFPIALSLMASFYSASSLIGIPAEIYQYGIQYWIITFGMLSAPAIGAYVTGPFFASHNIVSIFEFFELRFSSKRVRTVGMAVYVIKSFIASAIFMYGPATSLSYMTGLNEKIAIALIGTMATIYTTIGGIRAVIWTDLFQGLIMFVSLFMVVIKGIVDVGGFENLWRINSDGGRLKLFDFNPDPFIRQSFWSLFIGMNVNNLIFYCFDQQMMQRFQAAKTKKVAQRALLLNIPIVFVLMSLCCSVGLIVYANYFNCDPLTRPDNRIRNPNQIVPYFVLNNLYVIPGSGGLFLGALFCASLSSVSSSLNSQSSIIWTDFLRIFAYFKRFNDNQSVRTNKLIVLICGCISIGLSFFISSLGSNLVQIGASLNGAAVAPLIGLFILGLFFKVTNSFGAIFGTVIGFLASCWISFGSFVVKPTYPKLSTSIAGCPSNQVENLTTITTTEYIPLSTTSQPDLGFDKFYYLSFPWFTVFGTLVTMIFGLISSVLTKKWDKHSNEAFVLYDFFGFVKYFKRIKKNNSNDVKITTD